MVFPHGNLLRYEPSAKKSGLSAARLNAYRSARNVGEFFDLHPGPAGQAGKDLAWDLSKGYCSIPGFAVPRPLRSVRLGPVGKAHAIMRATSIVDPWAPLPAMVHAVGAATPRDDCSTESSLLA